MRLTITCLVILGLRCFSFADHTTDFKAANKDLELEVNVDPASNSIIDSRIIKVTFRPIVTGLEFDHIELDTKLEVNSARNWNAYLRRSLTNQTDPNLVSLTTYTETFELPSCSLWETFKNRSLAYFLPKDYPFDVTVHYRTSGSQDSGSLALRGSIHFESNSVAVVLGGIAGAVLLGLLRLSFRFAKRSENKMSLKQIALEIPASVIAASVTAYILTFLGDYTAKANLGIQISATSFQGGVIIGLASYKIGEKLMAMFFSEPPAPPSPDPAPTAPDPAPTS